MLTLLRAFIVTQENFSTLYNWYGCVAKFKKKPQSESFLEIYFSTQNRPKTQARRAEERKNEAGSSGVF